MAYSESRNRLLLWLTYASIGLFIVSNLLNFLYPGPDQATGEVQRVFYMHLGSFFGAFWAFGAAVVAGIAYLRTRNMKWDHLGLASVEIGLGLSAVNIVTGAIWARPTWGTFWTWDPRLTTITIMWLTYAAYLFLRSALEDAEQRRRFAAIYGILAFLSVILTVVIIRVRPDVIHPTVVGPSVNEGASEGDFGLTARISQTVMFSIFTYTVICATLVWHRIRLEERSESIQQRKMEALSRL